MDPLLVPGLLVASAREVASVARDGVLVRLDAASVCVVDSGSEVVRMREVVFPADR